VAQKPSARGGQEKINSLLENQSPVIQAGVTLLIEPFRITMMMMMMMMMIIITTISSMISRRFARGR
jgi:hypothetical protein